MLYWLFSTYRQTVAPFAAVPLVLAGLVMPFAAALALGAPGQRTLEIGPDRKERRLVAITRLVVALAAVHVALLMGGGMAVDRTIPTGHSSLAKVLIGPPEYERFRLVVAGLALAITGGFAALLIARQLQDGGDLREWVNRLRDPARHREELGSAHFCYPADFARLQRPKDEYELRLLGAFYGKRGRGEKIGRFYRLDKGPGRNKQWPWIALSAEDQARGMVLFGPTGTGKSQAGILPLTADAMQGGQSLVLLDPQGELLPYVLDYARVTGHQVVVHDPTDPALPRYNLAHGVRRVSDAQAIAKVLVSGVDFWSRSAQNLLAGCLLRFDSLGAILKALDDLEDLAGILTREDDGAANTARAFAGSVRAGDRSAPGVVATLQASTLGAWAEPDVQAATAATDFTAEMLIDSPTVLILRSPGRYMKVYGPYLGAVLQRLILDLDTLGEGSPGGMLPRPVKIVIDEFPVMGRLEGVVEAVNLFRKRRISIVLAAQTLAQFELVYGRAAAEALIAGLATQVYFGSCDATTARFVSTTLGRATERVPGKGTSPPQVRGRELLSVDEVITPPVGNCTILHRYSTTTYATQVVLLASLTYMFQREDWREAVARARDTEPLVMQRPLFAGRQGEDGTAVVANMKADKGDY